MVQLYVKRCDEHFFFGEILKKCIVFEIKNNLEKKLTLNFEKLRIFET